MTYAYKVLKFREYGEAKDEIQAFLNEINAIGGEIISIIPKSEGRYVAVFYKY